ncbi:MAG TPA: hypothetical protein VN670_10030 [Acidobacteriaceae bacterium]|jgi:hypothetical protein|nr:hypothetical protein [Acidobacteriaceae bacterium]
MAATIEFENDRVRVLRVNHLGREEQLSTTRHDRLIIYLNEGHIIRTENGKKETIQHKAGDVVWRNHSHHQIENIKDTNHEVIIVEFK